MMKWSGLHHRLWPLFPVVLVVLLQQGTMEEEARRWHGIIGVGVGVAYRCACLHVDADEHVSKNGVKQ